MYTTTEKQYHEKTQLKKITLTKITQPDQQTPTQREQIQPGPLRRNQPQPSRRESARELLCPLTEPHQLPPQPAHDAI